MLIFGHKDIESPNFVRVTNLEDISKTTPKDIILLEGMDESFDIAKHCFENSLIWAIVANSIKDAIYANALNVSYIIADFDKAKEVQSIANEYLWDAKILTPIGSDKELASVAKAGVDGVIFKFQYKG